ncbi:TonB-dependent receptor [Hirschia litorea]|uniref:TonB-dependent receptor n=1 Tax=Hirschia litorea TaxID=1199156 RepID=A0ABW2INJ8_9PROT
MRLTLKSLFASCISAALTMPAWAQAEQQEVIVVSASRMGEPLDQIAQSISVLDRSALNLQNADHISEALALVPGVDLHRGSGAEHLTAIRSPILTGGAGAGSFLYLQNGVALRSAGFANVNGLFDTHYDIAERIEVVRGPSGAVYGANAIHGVINVITPDASAEDSVMVSGDSQNRYKMQAVTTHSSGAHGFVIAASGITEAGYRQNAGLDQQKFTLRHQYDGAGVEIDTILSGYNLNQETAGFIFGRDALNDRDLRRENEFEDAYRDAKAINLQSTIGFDVSDKVRAQITPYYRWNEMEFLQHFLPSQAVEKNAHQSIGLQSTFSYEDGAVSILSGLDLELTEGELSEVQSIPRVFSYTQGTHYDYEVEAFSASAFVEGEYQFTDKTKLKAAVRVDNTAYKYDNQTDSGIVGRFLRLDDRDDDFVTVSPKLSLTHAFSEDVTGYVNYSHGARPPQTADLYRLQIRQADNPAEPEEIDAFELGMRADIHEHLRVEAVAYHMDKSNFFFRDADGFNVSNGKTRHQGIELDTQFRLSSSLSLSAAVSYARHTYRFDRDTGNEFESIQFGDDIDTAPRLSANVRGQWQVNDSIGLALEWVSLDEYYTDAANAHSYEGHNVLNLRTNFALNSNVDLGVSIRNLTDELYAERADYAFGEDRYMPGETRTFGVSLRFKN